MPGRRIRYVATRRSDRLIRRVVQQVALRIQMDADKMELDPRHVGKSVNLVTAWEDVAQFVRESEGDIVFDLTGHHAPTVKE